MSKLIGSVTSEKNNGPAIGHCCPACKKEHMFDLIERVSVFHLFHKAISRKKLTSTLICPTCSYNICLNYSDSDNVKKFKTAYDAFVKDSLSDAELAKQLFYQEIQYLNFDFKALEIAANRIIICPSCNEENQDDFEICWNCSKKLKSETAEDWQGFPFRHPEELRAEEEAVAPKKCCCG